MSAVNGEDETKQIEDCCRRMYEGRVQKDETLLCKVRAPSFVLVHMTGMPDAHRVSSRKSWSDEALSGDLQSNHAGRSQAGGHAAILP